MEKTGSKLIDASDVELSVCAVNGDQRAFLVLYDRYKKGLTAFLSKLLPVREEVEDVLLESFQKAFSQISTYNPQYRFSTWLFSIGRYTALDHIEKSGRVSSNLQVGYIVDESATLSRIPAPNSDPEEVVISAQEYDKLVSAVEGLSDLYRDIARMVLLENYGYEEVAKIKDLPLGTVKTRVRRARANILNVLKDSEEEEL